MYIKQKDDLLFIGLIFATFIALIIIIIQSRKYTIFLQKINPRYYFPTILEIILNTTILTLILLIGKLLLEKILHSYCEALLDEKYKKKENYCEKPKAKRKLSIYIVKFFHYLILTIHSYFIYDKLDFFPKELFGHGNANKLMTLHHFCTIILIIFSYYNHFDSIGSIILYLHNFSDIFVYLGRSILYTKIPGIFKKIFSICLLSSFSYFRLFVYGKLIYGYFIHVVWETFYLKNAFMVALVSLYTLHCTWTYKLVRIAYNSIAKSKFSDSRRFIYREK